MNGLVGMPHMISHGAAGHAEQFGDLVMRIVVSRDALVDFATPWWECRDGGADCVVVVIGRQLVDGVVFDDVLLIRHTPVGDFLDERLVPALTTVPVRGAGPGGTDEILP